MSKIKMQIITHLLGKLIEKALDKISTEEGKAAIDGVLDRLEDWILDTENKVDDITMLPIAKFIRRIADIPDND